MSQLFYTKLKTPIGILQISSNAVSLTGIWFKGQKNEPNIDSSWTLTSNCPVLKDTSSQLKKYFSKELNSFDIPLSFEGTDFQKLVWKKLFKIKFGETLSYSSVAEAVGKKSAVRAVATAIGKNPISIIVPCHRVIGKDKSLRGFASGVNRKEFLLKLEEK